jgi:hypothetical protein
MSREEIPELVASQIKHTLTGVANKKRGKEGRESQSKQKDEM